MKIPTIHWPNSMEMIRKFRGATDVTIACRFKELDQIFPNSLFIYTERSETSWLKSVEVHYLPFANSSVVPDDKQAFRLEADIRIYGKLNPKSDDFLAAYQRQHMDVTQYFRDKDNRLLKMNLTLGHGWEKLCSFLELTIPEEPFPHLNKKS